jgi:DNA replication protein DnaC
MPLEWWMTNNLLNALRADNFANHDQLLQRVKTCDLLVLDDLGAEHKTGWAEATLFSIVYERDMHNRLLLITSNISPRQLSERTRDRIYGKSEVIQMPDVSYRSRGKEWEWGMDNGQWTMDNGQWTMDNGDVHALPRT